MGLTELLCPHVRPLERSVGAPWTPLFPGQGHQARAPEEAFAVSDNLTSWDPYSGGDNLLLSPSSSPRPLPSRPAISTPWVTPSFGWNIAGPGGLDQPEWPIIRKGPGGSRYYQFGFQTPGQAPWGGMGHVGVMRPLPSVPPPMPFLGQPL